MQDDVDVVVIGAGFAGLAAARALAEQGRGVVILEALQRPGGRAWTLAAGHEAMPVELGPEFVHGAPGATHALVREARLALDPIRDIEYVRHAGKLGEAGDLWRHFGRLLTAASDGRADESARAYITRRQMSPDDARLFAHFVEGFYGASVDDISVASIAGDASGLGGNGARQEHVHGGYGRVVAWLADGLAEAGGAIRYGCTVHAIDWRTDRVEVAFRDATGSGTDETLVARSAIVTLPVGVLKHPGAVHFTPELGEHRTALVKLGMGQIVKVVLCLRAPVWEPRAPSELAFVHTVDRGVSGFPTFWLRTRGGQQQLTAWAGGPHARALYGCTASDLVERAIAGFGLSIGVARQRVADVVRDFHVHDYDADRLSRGAYSYTRVGGATSCETLARPLAGGRLIFAGEATDPRFQGTVAGALASGIRAAGEVATSGALG